MLNVYGPVKNANQSSRSRRYNDFSLGMVLDISKAIDTVDHQISISGIEGSILVCCVVMIYFNDISNVSDVGLLYFKIFVDNTKVFVADVDMVILI